MEDESYFSKVCLCRVILVRPPVSGDKSQSPLPGTEGYLSQRKIYALLLGR